MNDLQTSKEASWKPLDTFKMDAKSTNLIEHVQRNKPADQVSLHSIVSRPLSFNKLPVPQPRPQGLLAFQYGGGRREDPGTQQKHVTDLSTESGNLFKMAAKIKIERIWVRGLETGEKHIKWRQRQTQKKLKI